LVLSPREKDLVRRIAEQDGLSSAAAVRRMIRCEAQRRGLLPAPQRPAQCQEVQQ
jgi:hypothetical protein